MLQKIIARLRQEMTPLVRAELRASLEDSVRQELRREMLAAGTDNTTEASPARSLEKGLSALLDQSMQQNLAVQKAITTVRECSAAHISILRHGLEQLGNKINDTQNATLSHQRSTAQSIEDLPEALTDQSFQQATSLQNAIAVVRECSEAHISILRHGLEQLGNKITSAQTSAHHAESPQRNSIGPSLEDRLVNLTYQSQEQADSLQNAIAVVRECSAAQISAFRHELQQIAAQFTTAAKNPPEPPPIASSAFPGLAENVASELSAKMEQAMNLRVAEHLDSLREEHEQRILKEMEPPLRAKILEEVETEKQRLIEAATNQSLLEYLKARQWDGLGVFIDSLPPRLRIEAKSVLRETLKPEFTALLLEELRNEILADEDHPIRIRAEQDLRGEAKAQVMRELGPEIREQLLQELRKEVQSDENHPIRRQAELDLSSDKYFHEQLAASLAEKLHAQARDNVEHPINQMVATQLRSDPKFREIVASRLKSELALTVRKELRESLAPEVREALETQMLTPVLLNLNGEIEGSVAGILRRNMSACVDDLRETILDEIWQLVTTAMLESLGAAMLPFNSEGHPLSELALQAAIEVYKPRGDEARERLSSAVTAAVNMVHPGLFDKGEDPWIRFARIAQEVIDDRLIPSSFHQSRNLGIPDGFFRAVKTHRCHATKELIQPGDFYVVVRGRRIGLPLTGRIAEKLVEDTAANELLKDDTAIPPPWDGFPFKS
jgi:hypothetical protein